MSGNKNFGKHLKRLRELKGYSQEKLAEIVGVEYQTISRIETGQYFTGYDNLEKIAKALEIPVKELFDFEEQNMSKNEIINTILNDLKVFGIKDVQSVRKIIDLYKEAGKRLK